MITAPFHGTFNQPKLHHSSSRVRFDLQVPDALWDEIHVNILPILSRVLEGHTWLAGDQVVINPGHTELALSEARSSCVGTSRSIDAVPEILSLLTFLASNSFSTDEANVTALIIRLIEATKTEDLITKILCVPGPSTEALGEKFFQEAITHGNLRLLRVLLDSGLDPNSQMCCIPLVGAISPLCYAIQRGNSEVVGLLLKRGADPNGNHELLDQEFLRSPLIVAIDTNNDALVALLLENGASLDLQFGRMGQASPLYHAASCLNPDIVRILLENNARVDFVDPDGENCLLKALPLRWEMTDVYSYSEEIITDIVHQLVEGGASLDCRFVSEVGDFSPRTVLERAADLGLGDVFRYLLDQGAVMTSPCVDYAARSGSEDLVRFLLDQGLDPSSSLENLDYPLLAAIEQGHSDIATMLIQRGAVVEPKLQYYSRRLRHPTPLQAACSGGHSELVATLLAHGADLNASPPRDLRNPGLELNALSAAIDWGDEDIIFMLLDAGAEVNTPLSECVASVLTLSIQKGLKNVTERILACKIDLEDGGKGAPTALQAAINVNDAVTIDKLLLAGANINVALDEQHEYETPLTQAIEGKNYELIHRLIDGGADVNNPSARLYGRTALEPAASIGDPFLFYRLLGMGADPFDPQALLMAVQKSLGIEAITALLEKHKAVYGQIKKEFGGMALQIAVKVKQMPILEALLDAGIPADSVSQQIYKQPFGWHPTHDSIVQGETALGTAIRLWEDEDMPDIVMKLLSCGANPSGRVVISYPVKTALVAAIENGKANLLEMLLEAGANVSTPATGKMERTALQAAASSGRLSMVRTLIDYGAQINEKPAMDGGITALQAASIGGFTAIVQFLLSKGAEVDAPGAQWNGRTALEGAAEYGRVDTIQLLLDAGAAVHGEGEQQYKNSVQFGTEGGHLTAVRMLQRHHAKTMGAFSQNPVQEVVDTNWERDMAVPNIWFDEYMSSHTSLQPDTGKAEPPTSNWDIYSLLIATENNISATALALSSPGVDMDANYDFPIFSVEDYLLPFWTDELPN